MTQPPSYLHARSTIYTVGFTQKTAEEFFDLIKGAGVKRLVDVRLNNVSQLAGFAKRQDLAYFLKVICCVEYFHLPDLAPTQEMLDHYKKNNGSWMDYERKFIGLMAQRQIENKVPRDFAESTCLLCSEHDARHCHRRLVAEYLSAKWETPMTVEHLK
jgi:uncharacterized protein (DUF488 family)